MTKGVKLYIIIMAVVVISLFGASIYFSFFYEKPKDAIIETDREEDIYNETSDAGFTQEYLSGFKYDFEGTISTEYETISEVFPSLGDTGKDEYEISFKGSISDKQICVEVYSSTDVENVMLKRFIVNETGTYTTVDDYISTILKSTTEYDDIIENFSHRKYVQLYNKDKSELCMEIKKYIPYMIDIFEKSENVTRTETQGGYNYIIRKDVIEVLKEGFIKNILSDTKDNIELNVEMSKTDIYKLTANICSEDKYEIVINLEEDKVKEDIINTNSYIIVE